MIFMRINKLNNNKYEILFYKTLNLCIPVIGLLYTSCDSCSTSAPDDKYLCEFHNKYFQYTGNESKLNENDLSLFVDYSTCITLGQHSHSFKV